jgi:hypothetical protein
LPTLHHNGGLLIDTQWIGYAIAGSIVVIGNAVFQWWKGILTQKHGQQIDDFRIVVEEYKSQLKDLRADIIALTKEHTACHAQLELFKLRFEASDKTVSELKEKVTIMEAKAK